MPAKRKYATPSKKRARTGSAFTNRRSLLGPITRAPAMGALFRGIGFPDKLTLTLKYAEQFSLTTPASANAVSYVFSCNGLYDPNITGTGHQPLYFDQLMAIYDHYCVLRSKIKVTATSHPTTTTPQQVSVYIGDDASVISTQHLTLLEQSSARANISMLNGDTPKYLYNNWTAQDSFTKDPLAKDSLKGTSSANPTEQSTYIINVNDVSGVGVTTVYFTVEIEYQTTFFELTDIGGS